MKRLKRILCDKRTIFIFAFLLMFTTLLFYNDLYGKSGDAYETWKVVRSFFKNKVEYSYVMYKGIYAFVPGVISYNIGNLFGIGQFTILKVINSLGFAYITAIGIPNLVENLLGKRKINVYLKYIFVLLSYLLDSNVFIVISVDYYSAVLFVMLCNEFIKMQTVDNNKNKFIFGLLVGLKLSLSGQFSLATYLLLIYIVIKIIREHLTNINKHNIKLIFISFIIIISGYIITALPNAIYEEYVVNVGRENGAWIPEGSDWIKTGMSRDMLIINYPKTLPDNIGLSIMTKRCDDIDTVKLGGSIYDYSDYIVIFFRYPLEFSARIFERMFLGIIDDYKNTSFIPYIHSNSIVNLVLMLTCIYIALIEIKKRVKRFKDILNYKTLIILSSILTIVPPSLLHVENRYYLILRMLILASALFSISTKKSTKKDNILNCKINYNYIVYILYMIICITLYLAIYQSSITNAIF